jgi:hypothetical protein
MRLRVWQEAANMARRGIGQVVALVVGMLWLAGCSGQTTANIAVVTQIPLPTETPLTVANGLVTFRSPNNLYQLRYPATWTSNPLISTEGIPDGRDFTAPNNMGDVMVIPLSGATTAQMQAFVTGFLHDAGDASITVATAGPSLASGANHWEPHALTYSNQGQTYTGQILLATHAGNAVALVAAAPTAYFAATNANAFQPLIASFMFLN